MITNPFTGEVLLINEQSSRKSSWTTKGLLATGGAIAAGLALKRNPRAMAKAGKVLFGKSRLKSAVAKKALSNANRSKKYKGRVSSAAAELKSANRGGALQGTRAVRREVGQALKSGDKSALKASKSSLRVKRTMQKRRVGSSEFRKGIAAESKFRKIQADSGRRLGVRNF